MSNKNSTQNNQPKFSSKEISNNLIEKFKERKKEKSQDHHNLSNNLYQKSDEGLYQRKNKLNVLIGRIFIYNITLIKDELELFEPVYTISYKDIILMKTESLKMLLLKN